MSNSIRNNVEFRALLTRPQGATGKELQALTGRAYVYSTWSLWTMCDAQRPHLITQKDGKETRYFLYSDAQKARLDEQNAKREAKIAAKTQSLAIAAE